jgi:hypothetical protein
LVRQKGWQYWISVPLSQLATMHSCPSAHSVSWAQISFARLTGLAVDGSHEVSTLDPRQVTRQVFPGPQNPTASGEQPTFLASLTGEHPPYTS